MRLFYVIAAAFSLLAFAAAFIFTGSATVLYVLEHTPK